MPVIYGKSFLVDDKRLLFTNVDGEHCSLNGKHNKNASVDGKHFFDDGT